MKFLIQCNNNEIENMYKLHKIHHSGDSGTDLFIVKNDVINPGETKLVCLGIKSQLVSNRTWYCPFKKTYHSYMLFPRSSISKTPLRLANSIGLIDSGYTGDLKVALHNTGTEPFELRKGERYVQLVAPNLEQVHFKIVSSLRETSRGSGGFGSTN